MKYNWNSAELYESYVGRWSRQTAVEFLKWINKEKGLEWIEVGCGTGALTQEILKTQEPKKVTGVDQSNEYVLFMRQNINDPRAEFITGDACKLPIEDNSADVIVSGLVLNFIDDIAGALNEFKRITRSSACISAYVWDYAGKMELMRYFWDAAVSLFDDANELDEGVRFKICNPERLKSLFVSAGLRNVETVNIDIPTVFNDFDDYWKPFFSGIGPAPGYCMSLTEEKRELLKKKIYSNLPIGNDGRIELIARAIAVKGYI